MELCSSQKCVKWPRIGFIFYCPEKLHLLWKLTSLLRAICSGSRVMECCIRWAVLRNHPIWIHLRMFGMSWTGEWRKYSQQVGNTSEDSFKTVGKPTPGDDLMMLTERMQRACEAVVKVLTLNLKNRKYKTQSGFFNTFLLTTQFHTRSYFILSSVLMLTIIEMNEKHWRRWCVQTFDWWCMYKKPFDSLTL